jgi:two-component system response regulator YesN
MQKHTKKRKFGEHYVRYLISYMTVLLIPLVILTFFYSSRFMKKFYDEIYETVDLELLQISTQLDNELESMENIVGQITLTGTLYKASEANTPLALRPIITYLSALTSANPFIQDIVLILDGKEYVTTSSTTCQKDYYFNRIFRVPGMSSREFQDLLQNSTSSFCLPQQELLNLDISPSEAKVVLFSYPLFTDYQKHEGTALFYVKNSSIEALLSQKLKSYQAQIYILDQNGAVVTTWGDHDVMRDSLGRFLGESLTLSVAERIGGEEYVVRTHRSGRNNWTYLAFIPDRQTTFSQVNSIMREFLLTIVIILLLASFTIFFLQKVNYAPVRRLRDRAKLISPDGGSSDELETIAGALDYLSIQNSSLSTQLANSLTAVKNQRLYRLLSGAYASREDFNLDCSELDLSLPNEYFTVSIMMLHTPSENLSGLAQEIKKQFSVPYIYYYLQNFYPDQIVLLVNQPERSPVSAKFFGNVQKYLSKKYGLMTTIGIGQQVDSTQRIAQSYMEAVSALDYRFVKGNGTVIEFREVLGPAHTKVFYPHNEFEALRNALLSHKEQNIREAIQNIIGFMEQSQLPLYLARSICFDLIHLVNEHCRGQKNAASNSPLELSGMETAQEIIRLLQNWSENLHGLTTSTEKRVVLEEIINYLNENCLHCDFSVYEAAGHFEMTLPAFSKFFKDRTGQNVMEYTIRLRMERAKVLLRTTDLPIKEISEAVGYYNISSFTRRFKINQGVTTSEYRKISLEET